MKIEHVETCSADIIAGEIKIIEDTDLIGILEYTVKDDMLHVNNIKNKVSDCFGGIGSALMGACLGICFDKNVGFSFDVAKGSEEFYKVWAPRALKVDSTDSKIGNFFGRVNSKDPSRLTNRSLTYKFPQLEKCCQIDIKLDPCSYVKKKSTLAAKI